MRRTLAGLGLAYLLSGCMYSITELREVGAPHAFKSAASPQRAADCVLRNIETDAPGLIAQVRPIGASGNWEVVVQNPGYGPIAITDLVQAGNGSQGTMRFTPTYPNFPDRFFEVWTKGC